MLKGLVLIVAMLTASGIVLIQTPPDDRRPPARLDTSDPRSPKCEVLAPGIVRTSLTGEPLIALRDSIISNTAMTTRDPLTRARTVPSRTDTLLAWPVPLAFSAPLSAVRTTTTYQGVLGDHYTIETIETPGHTTLIRLAAADPAGEPASTGPLLRALRCHLFAAIAAVPSE